MLRFLFKVAAVVSVLLAAAASPAHARQFDFEDITLDNDLRVVTLEDFSTPIVAVQVWYAVGSKDEQPDRQGFAHMFEHMMFRGTDLLGPEDHFSLVRKTGGDCNAYTSFDNTTYINIAPSNQLELLLWLESQRMMWLKVDQEGFDTERKVVEEERRMGLNEPYGTVVEQVLPVLFTEHPYRWSPIGNIPALRAAKVEELKRFWEYYYVPNNAILVIVGAVKHADSQSLAKKYFGWMPKGDLSKRPKFVEPEQAESRSVSIEEPFGPVPVVGQVYRGVPENHDDAIPLKLLMIILGSGESSRIYKDLIKDRKLAVQAISDFYLLQDAGLFGAGAALNPMMDVDKGLEAIDEHLQALVQAPVSGDELAKAKNQLRRQVVTDSLTIESKAQAVGSAALLHGTPDWLNEQLEAIDAVTPEDLLRVAKSYITPERRTTVRVLPNPKKGLPEDGEAVSRDGDATPPSESAKSAAKRPDDYPTQPPVTPLLDELPVSKTERTTFDNGLEVVILPNHEVPFVSLLLGSKFGAWAEDPAAPGAASMAYTMLTKGTTKHSAAELAELIDFNALTLEGSATMDDAQVSGSCLADKLPLAVELLAEVVRHPTFPEDELALAKEQLATSLAVNENEPGYLADRELRRQLYGNHPYARSAQGEVADTPNLTRDRIETYWKEFLRPDASVLYIAGDVDPAEALELAAAHFGDWAAEGALPKPELPDIEKPESIRIVVVDRPGAVQSQIRLAEPSITRTDPDYHLARVYSQIYGGAFDSRLNKTIRVERGLTYGASGGITPQRFGGRFYSATFTKTETTAETVSAILEVMRGMKSAAPTEDELITAKSYLVGSLPGQLETPQNAVEYLWIIELFGLPTDYLNQAMHAYGEATGGDVARIAESVVDTDNLVIVVAGEAAKIKEGLEKIAPVTIVASQGEAGDGPESADT